MAALVTRVISRIFHQYTVTVNSTTRQLKRYTLGMAKTVCEDYATLLLNERVKITAKGFDALPGILTDNAFYDRCNRLVELTMALGTGALVEFLSAEGKPIIDYIRGDMIFPLSWDGDRITECAFGSRTVFGSGKTAKPGYYLQIHTKADKGPHRCQRRAGRCRGGHPSAQRREVADRAHTGAACSRSCALGSSTAST